MIEKNSSFLLYPTSGGSMFPFIRGGDYILVKKVPLQTIQSGDAIVFESDVKVKVCHRVVKIEKKDSALWFHTGGYKNSAGEVYPVRQERVLGKVVAINRKAGIITLPVKGLQNLFFKCDCFLNETIFYMKKFLAKIVFFKKFRDM